MERLSTMKQHYGCFIVELIAEEFALIEENKNTKLFQVHVHPFPEIGVAQIV